MRNLMITIAALTLTGCAQLARLQSAADAYCEEKADEPEPEESEPEAMEPPLKEPEPEPAPEPAPAEEPAQ